MDYRITTRDESETIHIAQNLESEKFENMIICLEGDLGSGKTIFTKGFAQALGIEENITSPVLWQDKRNSSYGLAKLCTRVFFVIGYIFVLVIMSEKTAFTRTDDKVCIVTVIVVNGLAAIRLYHAFFQKAIEAAIQEYD